MTVAKKDTFRQHPMLSCVMWKNHQFHVNESDRDYLCFHWWNDRKFKFLVPPPLQGVQTLA